MIVLSNCMYKDVPPLILEICRYFKGKAIDYANIFTSVCQKLLESHILIAGIATDNLPAHTHAVNFCEFEKNLKDSRFPITFNHQN